ncbi:MAG: DUF1186 domain-containing protein [Byssovorax sp.]
MRPMDLPALPTSALVGHLTTCGFDVPAGLPEEIVRRGHEAIAPLSALVYDDALWEAPDPPRYMAPFHALFLLGAIGDAAGAPALVDTVKTRDVGDFVTEEAPSILAGLDPAAIPLLVEAALDATLDTYQRNAFAKGLYGIAAQHPEHRAEVAALYVRLLANADEDLVGMTVDEAAHIDEVAVQTAIDRAFAEDRVPAFMIALADIEALRSEPAWHLSRDFMDPMAHFQRGALAVMKKNALGAMQQTAKAAKVGRNDPCPCGSGKKHKKCCLT